MLKIFWMKRKELEFFNSKKITNNITPLYAYCKYEQVDNEVKRI